MKTKSFALQKRRKKVSRANKLFSGMCVFAIAYSVFKRKWWLAALFSIALGGNVIAPEYIDTFTSNALTLITALLKPIYYSLGLFLRKNKKYI